MAQQSVPDPGDPGLDRGREVWPRNEGDSTAAKFQQMFRHQAASPIVVTGDQIKFAPLRERSSIAIEQHDGNAPVAEALGNILVDRFVPCVAFKRREENTGNSPFDELIAQ